MELIAVIMKAPTSSDRFETAKSLLSFGFANYALVPLPTDSYSVDVKLGSSDSVALSPDFSGNILLEKDAAAQLEASVSLAEGVKAPVAAGDKLGEIIVTAAGEEVARVALLAEEDVPRLSVFDILRRGLGMLI